MNNKVKYIQEDILKQININEKQQFLKTIFKYSLLVIILLNIILYILLNSYVYFISLFLLNIISIIILIYINIWLIRWKIMQTWLDIIENYKEKWTNYISDKIDENLDNKIVKVITKKEIKEHINKI